MNSQHRSICFISDILAIFIAYAATRLSFGMEFGAGAFQQLALIYCAYLPVPSFYVIHTPIFKRDFLKNLRISMTIWLWMILLLVLFIYAFRLDAAFRRGVLSLFGLYCLLLLLAGRMLLSWFARRYYRNPAHKKQLVVITNEANALQTMNRIGQARLLDYEVVGLVVYAGANGRDSYYYNVLRRKPVGKKPGQTYLGERKTGMMEFLKKAAIDEAVLSLPDLQNQELRGLIKRLEMMGINAHLSTDTFGINLEISRMESLGPYHVFTFSPRIFETQELALKRLMDIAGGLVGCVLCCVIGIFVGPAIYLEDPGPIIFKQKRVGKNGRIFNIYKFRSMYQDAEERKKELMAQNEMSGLMFKMKNDPRITKVGRFIRKTSLDEFPQFFNVLKGEMSLIGTRPPTVSEFEQYSYYHKRRLSLKPGITGMWQVTGRSDITDFEDVVKLDISYIDNWSIWLDIRILFQTVWVVATGKGSE